MIYYLFFLKILKKQLHYNCKIATVIIRSASKFNVRHQLQIEIFGLLKDKTMDYLLFDATKQ